MATPTTGHFVLHSNMLPTLTAGAYQLVSDHANIPFDVAEERTHVVVASPRYTMPIDQILSSFPPANAEGAFGDRLPQIVLKRRTLPWERNPAGAVAVSPTPWLALVVVAEGEAELSTATPVAQCVTAGTKLLDPGDKDVEQGLYLAVTETVVNKIFPCEQDLALLTHVRHVDVSDTELANGDDDGWLAVVMANRLPVFDTGTGRAVRYMACLVNVEGQLAELPPPVPPDDHFQFELAQDWSVLATTVPGPDTFVMSAELNDVLLPKPGVFNAPGDASPRSGQPGDAARTSAVRAANALGGNQTSPVVGAPLDGSAAMRQAKVSDQWKSATQTIAAAATDPSAAFAVRDTMGIGFRYPITAYALERVLRFPVLAHWSFTTTEGATFETLMQDLNVGLIGTIPTTPKSAPPPMPPPEVVETGHIGLDHRTRRGDPVRAWYRGPLVPFPTTRQQPVNGVLPVAHSADQLRRVVPDGREDLALSAAFEIGRLLGLSQLSVVSALLRFRAEQFGAGRIHSILDGITIFELPSIFEAEVDLGRFVAMSLFDDLVLNHEEMIGPRRPVADPGRPIEMRGELDAVIATGLGFDLATVRKRSDAVGVAAALAETVAPVAHSAGGVEFDKAVIAGLQGALAAEVNRVVGISLPVKRVDDQRRPGDRRRQATNPAPDVLGDLIERAAINIDGDED